MMVTAPGNEIRPDDVPAEFGGAKAESGVSDWTRELSRWAAARLAAGSNSALLDIAQPEFEKALICAALDSAKGRKQDAARLLGWGRNTLTRKMKELGVDS